MIERSDSSIQIVSRRNYLRGLGVTSLIGLASSTGSATARTRPPADERSSGFNDSRVVSAGGPTIEVNSTITPVGPGITRTRFTRLDERGWVRGNLLEVALDVDGNSSGLLSPGLTAAAPLSEMAANEGAIAGVNGDFFDISDTNAPIGAEIGKGELHKGPYPGHTNTVSVGVDGLGRIANVMLEGSVTLPRGQQPLTALNEPTIVSDGLGLYTPLWEKTSRTGTTPGASQVREVIVREGSVASISTSISTTPISEGMFVLIGREAGARALAELSIGDPVDVSYAPRTDSPSPLSFAVGGNPMIVRDGKLPAGLDDQRTEPRTAAGVSTDGQTMYLVAIDGRQQDSRGMTLRELGELLREFGTANALNLDGGGSTTMVARQPGTGKTTVSNDPSGGSERAIPNGVGLFAPTGSDDVTGIRVEPRYTVDKTERVFADLPRYDTDDAERVFPGLTRSFVAYGYNETYAPVDAGRIRWHATPGSLGRSDVINPDASDDEIDSTSVFTARKPGRGTIQARHRGVVGEIRLAVLGTLDRIEATTNHLSLAGADSTDTVRLVGYDADGYRAPIEPRDVTVTYDESVVDVTAVDGGFTVTAKSDSGSALLTLTVGDAEAFLPVTIGLETKLVTNFEDRSRFSFLRYPEEVSGRIESAPGHRGQGLALEYSLTGTDASRAAYVVPDPALELPGSPQQIGLWVNGDGNGGWLRAYVRDNAGVRSTLTLAPEVTWTGWRYVETAIPATLPEPLSLERIYIVETNPEDQYSGRLVFDELQVKVPPPVDTPDNSIIRDPTIVTNAAINDERWRFAVLADSQFVAGNPNSELVQLTRRTLRQIVSEDPDFLVINGDFVDTGYEKDFQLAQRILDEEVGDGLPVYYVPGNHERMGTGSLANFREVFGKTHRIFDHRGTRFILLNSSTGSFRTANFEQLIDLKSTLGDARTDSSVESVVVMAHHPTRDPLATDNSQLADRQETATIEEWLTDFEVKSGKSATYIGSHAGTAHATHVDGVPYLVTPSAGKDPYGPATNGGFTGWMMIGVDPTHPKADSQDRQHTASSNNGAPFDDDALGQPLRVAMRPHLDEIVFDAPETVTVDETATVTATGIQPDDRQIPMRYPATVRWSGSENLLIGSGGTPRGQRYDAVFDPVTNKFEALQTGQVTLRVESNEKSAETTIQMV